MLDEQLEIIDLLLRHGADACAADAADRAPADWARSERVVKAFRNGLDHLGVPLRPRTTSREGETE
jgi:hypothetical protein